MRTKFIIDLNLLCTGTHNQINLLPSVNSEDGNLAFTCTFLYTYKKYFKVRVHVPLNFRYIHGFRRWRCTSKYHLSIGITKSRLNLVQAYFLENCVQMQKYENSLFFSNFQLVLLRTSELEFTWIWPILLRSQGWVHFTRHKTSISHGNFDFQRMHSKKSLTYRAPEMWDPRERKIGHYGVKISKSFFWPRPGSIVFSSFCRSRKVVWNQSELKNRMTNGLASFP